MLHQFIITYCLLDPVIIGRNGKNGLNGRTLFGFILTFRHECSKIEQIQFLFRQCQGHLDADLCKQRGIIASVNYSAKLAKDIIRNEKRCV